MNYWLVKTEPHVYSIDDLRRDKKTLWTGVRNYQARNFLQQMTVGDTLLVYHSNAEPPGVVGLATVVAVATPDPTQFDERSEYFDPKSSNAKPRWFCPQVAFARKLPVMVSLHDLRQARALDGLALLQRGSRLSVIPVVEKHFRRIVAMGEGA
jgi:predicted RNA-binding protein with PUA-like domain